MGHNFEVGSAVWLKPQPLNPGPQRYFEVVRHMPADVDGVPAYRLKDASGQEHAARSKTGTGPAGVLPPAA